MLPLASTRKRQKSSAIIAALGAICGLAIVFDARVRLQARLGHNRVEPKGFVLVVSDVKSPPRSNMPTDVIPVLEQRPARFERYENFVTEAADAADKEGRPFIVGVKERRVVAVNLLNERENTRTFMHRALGKPAVQIELDGGYERFLASISETGHKEKVNLVASALSRERERGVPLRSRRILDVDKFLERNTPIPAFSEAEYALSHPPTRRVDVADGILSPPHARTPEQGVGRDPFEGPTTATRQHSFEVEVRLGLVPPSVDVTALSARWRERARWNLPAFAESDAGVLIEDRLVRDHFHDAVFSAAKHLDMGLDPRPLLSTFHDQLVSLSVGENHAECRALARMYADYKQLLAVARPAEPQSM